MEYICTKSFTSKSGDYYVIGKVITRFWYNTFLELEDKINFIRNK